MDDASAQDVAAMQFAGGRSMAQVAEQWDREVDWVEAAVRRALLATIPARDGGTKQPRAEVQAERRMDAAQAEGLQPALFDELL